jgi:integrase
MTERRRAKGEGTVRERSDGLWEAREPPEIVPFGEKPRSFYGKNKSEAVRKLREALRERERGFSPSVDRITVGEYLERWIEGPLRGSVSEKTYDDYAWVCRKYLIPEIGRAKLKKLTAEHLDDLYARKAREGLSPRTVAYIHATIRVALQRAVKKRLIPFNVARDADPPSRSAAREDEKLTLTGGELAAFFKAAAKAEDRFETLFIVGALAGPRPQELLGLKWPDLMLPETPGSPGEMQLLRRVSMSSEGLKIVEGLKGSRGKEMKRRTVYLLPEAVAALKAHRRRYLEERVRYAERWGKTWQNNPKARDLVFPSETGGPMNRDNLLKRHFKPLARMAKLPKEATLYTLRHTFATLWLESGENPKVLQEILGHSRIDVTLNVYSHVLPHIQRDAMERFGQRFFGPS